VAGIAAEIGYKDAGNFTRAFKRWTGISRKVYLQSISK
jgi:AraC-like DNA-binding protein